MHKIKRYGWVKDHLDRRDRTFSGAGLFRAMQLPPSVDLRPKCPPVFDQGDLGSCTANAISGSMAVIHPGFIGSRLFIYYNERCIEWSVNSDSGAQIRDGIKSLVKWGVCPESQWPYDISKFTVEPSEECYAEAKKDIISGYYRLPNNLTALKTCLAQGFPFVVGIVVYDSFEAPDVAKSGLVPMPKYNEQPVGGHAVMIAGYDDAQQCFLMRNSWGADWGQGGYCWIPYQYLLDADLSSDMWTIRS